MSIDTIIDYLNRLYGAPAVLLVLGSCIVVGYVLRFIKGFPNDGIPLAVVLWGAIAMCCLADKPTGSVRVWIFRNIFVGLIIGFAAWLLHNRLLSKVEDWLTAKFPGPPNDQTKL